MATVFLVLTPNSFASRSFFVAKSTNLVDPVATMRMGMTLAVALFFAHVPLSSFAAKDVTARDLKWKDLSCRATAVGLDVRKLSPLARAVVLRMPELRYKQGIPAQRPYRLTTSLENYLWKKAIKTAVARAEDTDFYLDVDSEVVTQLLAEGYSAKTLANVAESLQERLIKDIARIEDLLFTEDAATLFDLAELSALLAALNDPLGLMFHAEKLAKNKGLETKHTIVDRFRPEAPSYEPERRSALEIVNSVYFAYGQFIPNIESYGSDRQIAPDHFLLPGDGLSAHGLNLLAGLPVVTLRTRGGLDSFSDFLEDVSRATQYSLILFPEQVENETPMPRAIENRYLTLVSGYVRAVDSAALAVGAARPDYRVLAAVEGLFYLATHHAEIRLTDLPEKFGESFETVLNYLQVHQEKTEYTLAIPELLSLLNDPNKLHKQLDIKDDLDVFHLLDAAAFLTAGYKKSASSE